MKIHLTRITLNKKSRLIQASYPIQTYPNDLMVHTPWSQRCGLHAGTPRNIKRDVSMQKLRFSNSGRCNLQSWVKHLFVIQWIWSLKSFIKDPWRTFSDTQVIIATATSFAGLTASPMFFLGEEKVSSISSFILPESSRTWQALLDRILPNFFKDQAARSCFLGVHQTFTIWSIYLPSQAKTFQPKLEKLNWL